MYRNKGYCAVTCPSLNKSARALIGSRKNPFISKRTASLNVSISEHSMVKFCSECLYIGYKSLGSMEYVMK